MTDPKKRTDIGYEVGYGKPPKSGQFKPGASGNPRGRPKAPRNARESIQKTLDEKVTIRKNGEPRTVSRHEAIAELLAAQALSLNPRDRLIAIRALREFGGTEVFSGGQGFDEDEAAGLADVFEKMGLPSPDPVTPDDYALPTEADKDLGKAEEGGTLSDQPDPSFLFEGAEIVLTHPDPDIDPTIPPRNKTGYPISTKSKIFATCWQRRYVKHGDVQRSAMHSRIECALDGKDIHPGNPELNSEEEEHLAWLRHHSSQ